MWNTAWAIGFGAASLGQLGVALSGETGADLRDAAAVGAAKAGLGAASRFVVPLAIAVPPQIAEACADRDALTTALADAGKRERANFWLGHLGSIAVNFAGTAILVERRSWRVGLESLALGYPVGLLAIYTAPRDAWHHAIAPTPTGVAIAGAW